MTSPEALTSWIPTPATRRPDERSEGLLPAGARDLEASSGREPGPFSLRQIVASAVSRAEIEAIRRALVRARGNKSRAARLLRANYSTLHLKMKRYRISAREFRR